MDGTGDETLRLWQEFTVSYRYPVVFTRQAFSPGNRALADLLGNAGTPAAVFPVADAGVMAADPALAERLGAYASRHPGSLRLLAPVQVLPGGEKSKDGPGQVERLHRLFLKHRLCRHSVVLAMGGGAFLDVVGYAASTAHRGIRLLRMPTTTLSQNDAGVGVKNGYNSFGRKNWVGTFVPPFAVLNDFQFLGTLPERHLRSGMAEAVKVAVIKDADFFRFLFAQRARLATFCRAEVEEMVVRCAGIHLAHIAAGDPFESGSARPLDFGHWAAHAIEDWCQGDILHGEAVAAGIALDCLYAAEIGLVSPPVMERVIALLRDLGFLLAVPALRCIDLQEALDRFRQHLGGRLAVTLPTGIGSSREVDRIDLPLLQRCRERLMLSRREEDDEESSHGRRTAGT
jgi:3-dehydroquinate synthase